MMFNFLDIFQFRFMIYAIFATILLGISSSFSGNYLMHKKMSFLSPGIAHAAFAGVALAFLLNVNPYLIAVLFALLVVIFIHFIKEKADIHYDISIGIVFTFEMALAIVFISLMPDYKPELYTFLFGNVLTVTFGDLIGIAIVSALVVSLFVIFYRYFAMIVFDEEIARNEGLNVKLFNNLFLLLIALNIVFSIKAVGTILIFAYILIPPTIAYQMTHDLKKMLLFTIVISIIASVVGFVFSFMFDIPSGSTVVITMTAMLFGAMLFFKKRLQCREKITKKMF